MSKIEINNVYKIFGNNPSSVMPMVRNGANKEEVLEKTGHTVGLDNVSLKIEEGETFVCMGLSGSGKSTLIRHLNRLIDPTDGEILVEGTNVMSLGKEQLIALESGDESALPEKVFIRAMVRRIAEKLNLDTSFILEELNEKKKNEPKPSPVIKKKNTRKKLRGGAKKEDIITNETQISNLDPNTIIKDIDVGGITNPLGESVDEQSESDEMYPPDPDIQIQRDMILARKLNLENEVQTPEVKQEIERLNEALEIEPIHIEDKVIDITPIESLGNKEYYNTTNFSIHEVLINISGKLTKICDIRPTDSSKCCEELYYSSETEKENLTKMWLETNFTYLNFFS